MSALSQKGFTLIELMIAIVLGLLLVAAAFQLYFNSQAAFNIQKAGDVVQDSGVLGLAVISQSIRLANHGNTGAMNDETLRGGVILTGNSASTTPARSGNLNGYTMHGAVITDAQYLTTQEGTSSAYGAKSDRLVIMYQAPKDMNACDGTVVKGPQSTATGYSVGQYVIEKYIIKKTGTADAPDAALTCNAAVFDTTVTDFKNSKGTVQDYGTDGYIVLNHVDAMKIQLLIRNSSGIQNMSVNAYKAIAISDTPSGAQLTARPAIIGINLALLVRSDDKLGSKDGAKTFNLLGTNYTAPDDGYLRKVYTTTIAFRNGGLGEVIP